MKRLTILLSVPAILLFFASCTAELGVKGDGAAEITRDSVISDSVTDGSSSDSVPVSETSKNAVTTTGAKKTDEDGDELAPPVDETSRPSDSSTDTARQQFMENAPSKFIVKRDGVLSEYAAGQPKYDELYACFNNMLKNATTNALNLHVTQEAWDTDVFSGNYVQICFNAPTPVYRGVYDKSTTCRFIVFCLGGRHNGVLIMQTTDSSQVSNKMNDWSELLDVLS